MIRTLCLFLMGAWLAIPPAYAGGPDTVQFQSLHRDRAMLRGYVMKPEGDGPFPTVLLLHGCGGPVTPSSTIRVSSTRSTTG